MNRSLTALFAAFEAALVVAIGVGISLAPLTILWGVQFGFQVDWIVFWRASADIWLVGHGVDMIFALDPATAATLGLAGADAAFPVRIAALGFAMLTVLLGVRAGRRVAETNFLLLGELVAVGTFGLLSLAVTLSALHPLARPSIVQGAIVPTLIFGAAVFVGSLRSHRPSTDATIQPIRAAITKQLLRMPRGLRVSAATALRGGLASATAVIAVAAVLLAVLVAVNYAQIVGLYEGLHTEVLGGAALTLAQLAFIPTFVIWAASWLVGPGFAIGVGSSVSPLGTSLGPIPAIPVFGALPTGDLSFGFVGLLVPVVAAFLAAALLRPKFSAAIGDSSRIGWTVATGLGMGLVGGVALGLLASFASGAAGPGRLSQVGPDPLSVGLWAGVEIGLAALLGLLAAPRRSASDDKAAPASSSSAASSSTSASSSGTASSSGETEVLTAPR
ncbi:hypothetical protein GCM10027413_31000 [Conyzicola nivalis]|uniref:Uncharacterized protein n=1 Tax=Conyzicola nivalis TaxID=1477021 RepID=A0A916WMN9_9MICO|nr:DUF6350 family protein [Conyzicola nivalis]GGB12473.1 hypothetical protein GCM10010979_28520 [Conyzicola nivalis]